MRRDRGRVVVVNRSGPTPPTEVFICDDVNVNTDGTVSPVGIFAVYWGHPPVDVGSSVPMLSHASGTYSERVVDVTPSADGSRVEINQAAGTNEGHSE